MLQCIVCLSLACLSRLLPGSVNPALLVAVTHTHAALRSLTPPVLWVTFYLSWSVSTASLLPRQLHLANERRVCSLVRGSSSLSLNFNSGAFNKDDYIHQPWPHCGQTFFSPYSAPFLKPILALRFVQGLIFIWRSPCFMSYLWVSECVSGKISLLATVAFTFVVLQPSFVV